MPKRGPSWIRLWEARLPSRERHADALLVEHADVMDVVVVGEVVGGREGVAVAAADRDAAAADIVDVVAGHAVVPAAVYATPEPCSRPRCGSCCRRSGSAGAAEQHAFAARAHSIVKPRNVTQSVSLQSAGWSVGR